MVLQVTHHQLWELISLVGASHAGGGEKKWGCQHCGAIFRSKTFYNIHKTTNHFEMSCIVEEEDASSDKEIDIVDADIDCKGLCSGDTENHFVEERPAPIDENKSPTSENTLKHVKILKQHETTDSYDDADSVTFEDDESNVDIEKPVPSKRFPCSLCDKTFKNARHRNRHEKVHTLAEPYACHASTRCGPARSGPCRRGMLHYSL